MNGSTILAGIFAASGLVIATYAWAPRGAPDSPESSQFPNAPAFTPRSDVAALGPAAAAGDPAAQYELWLALDAAKDDTPEAALRAAEWLVAAAESGHPAAANAVGVLYRDGAGGFARDEDAAFRWFRRAASGGDADGETNLARAFRDGAGASRDEQEAARQFLLAAKRGSPAAQFNLALLLREGEGVKRSRETSRRAAEAARRQGYGADRFYADELATLDGRKLNGVAALASEPRLSFQEPAHKMRCRAMFADLTALAAADGGADPSTADKQRAVLRVAALLGDPYAQSAIANYWRARPTEPQAAEEERYWRMRAAENPLKLEIPADCRARQG